MPAKKPYRKQDKWANEKELAVGIGSGINDVFGRGTLAGLLGAPGDIAGMAENGIRALIGLPQVQPWGGSEHIGQKMQDYGLVSSVRRPKTELLASLISPAQIATASLKAPAYAKTALRLLDNLESAPTMARIGQRGAIDVWHGSPHKFDTFKAMDNIGGGEGAQAYGHGGYHASVPEVAKSYAGGPSSQIDARSDGTYRAMILDSSSKPFAAKNFDSIEDARDFVKAEQGKLGEANLYRNQLRWPDPAREAADPLSDKHFLDWDKPLSEQSASVKELLPDFSWLDRPVTSLQGRIRLPDGSFADSEQQLSMALSARGIPGIRYLDGGSRSAGQGSHNYVTFDDALVNILERNGQPVTAPQPGLLGKMVAPQDEALRVAQANALPDTEAGYAPIGSWVRDPFAVNGKTPIRQVREIPIDRLHLPELDSAGKILPHKAAYVERYADAMRNGDVFPNLRGSELESGMIKIQDGHRRALAAKLAGKNSVLVNVDAIEDYWIPEINPRRDSISSPTPETGSLLSKLVAPQDEALRIAQQNAAKPVSEGGLGLRPDNTPEERAAAMGFDIPVYHATDQNFTAFDPLKRGTTSDSGWYGDADYTAPSPDYAARFIEKPIDGFVSGVAYKDGGNIMPLLARAENPYDWRANEPMGRGLFQNDRRASIDKRKELQGMGHDSVAVNNSKIFLDDGQELSNEQWDILTSASPMLKSIGKQKVENLIRANNYDFRDFARSYGIDAASAMPQKSDMVELATFNPSQLRSRFAAFDPMRKDSSDLLAGLAPFGAVPWLYGGEE